MMYRGGRGCGGTAVLIGCFCSCRNSGANSGGRLSSDTSASRFSSARCRRSRSHAPVVSSASRPVKSMRTRRASPALIAARRMSIGAAPTASHFPFAVSTSASRPRVSSIQSAAMGPPGAQSRGKTGLALDTESRLNCGVFDPGGARERMDLKKHIRGVPDFPKKGILFYDISTLLAHAGAWRETMRRLADALKPHKPDLLVGIESRGFLVAAPLALELGCGFVMVRKKGKLPGPPIRFTYELEYGNGTIEIQADAIRPGSGVVVLDDLLATGGTLAAAIKLCRQVGGDVVASACIIELSFLDGPKRLDVPFTAVVSYDS